MATKAKVFEEYVKVRSEYYDLIGKEDKNFYGERVYNCNTKQDLEYEIKHYKERIEFFSKSVKIDKWKQTDEGIAYYNAINSKSEELKNKISEIYTNRSTLFKDIVKTELGDKWDVSSVGDRMARIGIVDKECSFNQDGTPKFLFGHSFEILYDYEYVSDEVTNSSQEFKVKLTYGTMGGFDLNSDFNRIELIKGMAKFLSENIIKFLTKELKGYTDETINLRKELYNIDKLAENPPIDKAA